MSMLHLRVCLASTLYLSIDAIDIHSVPNGAMMNIFKI